MEFLLAKTINTINVGINPNFIIDKKRLLNQYAANLSPKKNLM